MTVCCRYAALIEDGILIKLVIFCLHMSNWGASHTFLMTLYMKMCHGSLILSILTSKNVHTTCSCWLESSFHVQKVEEDLKDVKESSADCILDYIKYLQSLEWCLSVGFTKRSSLLLISNKEDWKKLESALDRSEAWQNFWHFFHKFERLQHITLVLILSHTRETGLFGQVFEGNEAEHDALII